MVTYWWLLMSCWRIFHFKSERTLEVTQTSVWCQNPGVQKLGRAVYRAVRLWAASESLTTWRKPQWTSRWWRVGLLRFPRMGLLSSFNLNLELWRRVHVVELLSWWALDLQTKAKAQSGGAELSIQDLTKQGFQSVSTDAVSNHAITQEILGKQRTMYVKVLPLLHNLQ